MNTGTRATKLLDKVNGFYWNEQVAKTEEANPSGIYPVFNGDHFWSDDGTEKHWFHKDAIADPAFRTAPETVYRGDNPRNGRDGWVQPDKVSIHESFENGVCDKFPPKVEKPVINTLSQIVGAGAAVAKKFIVEVEQTMVAAPTTRITSRGVTTTFRQEQTRQTTPTTGRVDIKKVDTPPPVIADTTTPEFSPTFEEPVFEPGSDTKRAPTFDPSNEEGIAFPGDFESNDFGSPAEALPSTDPVPPGEIDTSGQSGPGEVSTETGGATDTQASAEYNEKGEPLEADLGTDGETERVNADDEEFLEFEDFDGATSASAGNSTSANLNL